MSELEASPRDASVDLVECARILVMLHELRNASDLLQVLSRRERLVHLYGKHVQKINAIVTKNTLVFFQRKTARCDELVEKMRQNVALSGRFSDPDVLAVFQEIGLINEHMLRYADLDTRRKVMSELIAWEDVPPAVPLFFPVMSLRERPYGFQLPSLLEPSSSLSSSGKRELQDRLYRLSHDLHVKPFSISSSNLGDVLDPLSLTMLSSKLHSTRQSRPTSLEKEIRFLSALEPTSSSVQRLLDRRCGMQDSNSEILRAIAHSFSVEYGACVDRLIQFFDFTFFEFWKKNESADLASALQSYLDPGVAAASPTLFLFLFRTFVRQYLQTAHSRFEHRLQHRLASDLHVLHQWIQKKLPASLASAIQRQCMLATWESMLKT
eukprot:ANDGO_06592.mRNA.1 hypothetical protein